MRSSDTVALQLEDVCVGPDALVGELHSGYIDALRVLERGRVGIAALSLGLARAALEESVAYAQQRQAFGKTLADLQAIQFMLADMAIGIFTMKYTTLRVSDLAYEYPTTGRLPIKEISLCKAYAVETCQAICDKAIQIHGAMGLSSEMGLEEAFRIARTLRIPDGTGEIMRRTIAGQLLRGDTVF